ncbi:MAG: DUF4175 family protein [Candidatus Latescibacterota bacterium]
MVSVSEEAFAKLERRLSELRLRALLVEGAVGLLRLAGTLLIGLLVWIGLEALFYFSPPVRAVLGAGAIVAAFGYGAQTWRQTIPRLWDRHRFALHVEQCCPHLAQRLISALELCNGTRARGFYSPDLLAATVQSAADEVSRINLSPLVDGMRLRSSALFAGGALVAVVSSGVLAGDLLASALHRCAHPLTAFERPAQTQIDLAIDQVEVVRGEDVHIVVRFSGDLPASARVLRRESAQAEWRGEEVVVAGVDSLRYALPAVQRSFQVQVAAGDGLSRMVDVRVIDPPAVKRLRLRYRYPPYSQLPERVEEDGGDIQALVGTHITFEIVANKVLAEAALVVEDSVHLPARIEGDKARVDFTLERSGSYRVHLRDTKGVLNRDPIAYSLRAVDDQPPRVAITDPGRDTDLPDNKQVQIGVEASDDFGVARAELVYGINEGTERRIPLGVDPARQVILRHLWDLSNVPLMPEDRVHYFVEVFDNDEISGAKSGRSERYVLRLASLRELYEESEEALEARLDAVEELVEQGRDTREYLEEVRREVLRKEELSWETERALEDAIERESERSKQLEEMAAELEKSGQKIDEKGLGNSELFEKLEEIRQLMAEVAAPELQEALRELQKAMEDPDPQALAESLKQFSEDQEAFQERLDRTIELLKQVRAEQQFEAVVDQASELAERQRAINSDVERGEAGMRQQMQQGALRRDSENLQSQLEELAESLDRLDAPTADQVSAQAEQMKSRQMSGRMREMIQQMRAKNNPQAERLGAGLEEDLGQLSANLSNAKAQFVAEQKQEMSGELRRAMRDMIGLSQRQEALANSVRARPNIDSAEPAEDQFALLQGAGLVAERLAVLARRTMSLSRGLNTTLGYALNSMGEAARHLGQRDRRSALEPQQQAMRYANETVVLLRESLNNLSNASMPSSFAEAMQKMMGLSEQQAQLNQAAQQALAQAQAQGQGRPVPGLDGEIRRLSAEQERVYQALQELHKSMRGHKGAQGQIEAIQEEMREVLGDLQQRRLNARTLEKQERIFQRMLESSRSIHSRGFKEDREATGGRDQPYSGPPGMPEDLGQVPDVLRQAMRQALEGAYPAEYRHLLERYYEQVYEDALQMEGAP